MNDVHSKQCRVFFSQEFTQNKQMKTRGNTTRDRMSSKSYMLLFNELLTSSFHTPSTQIFQTAAQSRAPL